MKRKKERNDAFFLIAAAAAAVPFGSHSQCVFAWSQLCQQSIRLLFSCEQSITISHWRTKTCTHTHQLAHYQQIYSIARRIALDSYFYSQFNCSIRCEDTRIRWRRKKKSIPSSLKGKKRWIFRLWRIFHCICKRATESRWSTTATTTTEKESSE